MAQWPHEQLLLCAEAGVFKWFVGEAHGGNAVPYRRIIEGYIQLAQACLTTAFVITQRTGACKRIENSENVWLQNELLPKLAEGEIFATLGISHLTTSRRHLGSPVMLASRISEASWELNGFCPWVTGGSKADYVIVGAETENGEHIFFAVPAELKGVVAYPGIELTALTSSQTNKVEFNQVELLDKYLIAGPIQIAESSAANQNTGGLQTSALAIGLGAAAVEFVTDQAKQRPNLLANSGALRSELKTLTENILDLAGGNETCNKEELRSSANSFALRATQSALIAAKGAGFVAGHEVGRWCQEALFFLVWSCPPNVSDVNLCEFAGISA